MSFMAGDTLYILNLQFFKLFSQDFQYSQYVGMILLDLLCELIFYLISLISVISLVSSVGTRVNMIYISADQNEHELFL